MPTETTVAPFRYEEQLGGGFGHPSRHMHAGPAWGGSMPPTGPARIADCVAQVPGSGRILPNGLRNPWAPHAGETYQPAAVAATNMQMNRSIAGGGVSINGSMAGGYGPGSIAPSYQGGGGTMIAPRSLAGGSVATGLSAGSYGTAGGMRLDDGWNGSVGRDHRGFAPDLSSAAGGLPRIPTASNWLHANSSPLNHAPLSQVRHISPVLQPTPPMIVDEAYPQPPISNSLYRPRRAASLRPVPIDDDCPDCAITIHGHCHGGQRQRSTSNASSGSHRGRDSRDVGRLASGQEHYRKLNSGSPSVRHSAEMPLSRKVSGRSRLSSSHSTCRECVA